MSVILAGSVGLHHVLTDMSPVNDLDGVPIGPLDPAAAVYLARCLLLGATQPDDVRLATDIATQAAGVPFYIHKIVQEIAEGWSVNDADDLDALVEHALRTNHWGTEHDLTRMAENFAQDASLALALLDVYAVESGPLSIEQVCARLAVTRAKDRPSRTKILEVLARLEDDHYLDRVGNDNVVSHELQRRIWRIVRRLP